MIDDSSADKKQPPNEPAATAPQNAPPLFFFESMARGGKEVLINHNEQLYRLRVTKNGKLILNK
jgi:hemin uptake protein HemP